MNKSILGITLLLVTQTHTANQKYNQPSEPVPIPGTIQTDHHHTHRTQTLRRDAQIPPKVTASAPPFAQQHYTPLSPPTEGHDTSTLKQPPSHLYPSLPDQPNMYQNKTAHIPLPVTEFTPPVSFEYGRPVTVFDDGRETSDTDGFNISAAEITDFQEWQAAQQHKYVLAIHDAEARRNAKEQEALTTWSELGVSRGRTSPTLSTVTVQSAAPPYGPPTYRSPLINWVYEKYDAFKATQAATAAEVLRRIKAEEQKIIAAESAVLPTETSPSTRRRLPSFKSKKALAKGELLRQQRGRTASIEAASEGMRDVGADLDLYIKSSTVTALQSRKKEASSQSDNELNV